MERHPKPTAAAKQKILADHRIIGQLISDIASLDDPAAITKCVQQLLPVLRGHFAEEEQEIDGLHAVVERRTPQHHEALLALKQEHALLMSHAEQLLAAARAAKGADTELRRLGRQLRTDLAAHESRETEVFMDSIWTDFGGSD